MLRILCKTTCSFLFLLFLFLLTGTGTAEDNQRLIAVAAESTEVTSQINKLAARAPYFLIFDEQSKLLDTLPNPAVDAPHKAGPKAAAFLSENRVNLVIAGQFGRKMLDALKSSQIETVEHQGRVIDAVKEQNHAQ